MLRPWHHRTRSAADRPAVRALYLERAQRAAGYRRGLRARAPRGSHSVRIPALRPPPRRAYRRGQHLPRRRRGTRRSQGTRPTARAGRRAGQLLRPLERPHATSGAPGRGRLRSGKPGAAPRAGAHRPVDRLSPPSVAASRRLRHLRAAAGKPGAGGERRHGRAHHHPVGQGRPRRGGPAQGRYPCPGNAQCLAPLF
ncbi:hypothetical protein D3C76_1349330 [compost metagenome]